MNAVEYLKTKERMCDFYRGCLQCPLSSQNNKIGIVCRDFEKNHPEDAVVIVEKWSAEHPKKTRQSEFLKMFPNAKFDGRIIDICPKRVDTSIPERPNCYCAKCSECKKQYWLAEVE